MRRAMMMALVVLGLTGGSRLRAETAVAAALVWARTEVSLTAAPGQERCEVAFPFRNTGAKAVTVTGVESSCGCTTAQLAKTTYAPGEGGEIRATFEFGARTGAQQKVLTVTTDDGAAPTQLRLQVTIPVLFDIEQRLVIWARGAEPDARTVIVRMAAGVTLDELTYDRSAVEATVTPLPEGGGQALSLRLKSTAEIQRQTVLVHAMVQGKAQALPVHLFVR